jgi:hypothetical protein
MARTSPVREQRLQGPVGLQGRFEVRWQRLVQDQQVDLVDSKLAGALVEAVQRLVVAVVADPDLGLQKDLRAVQARTAHRFSDLPLVVFVPDRMVKERIRNAGEPGQRPRGQRARRRGRANRARRPCPPRSGVRAIQQLEEGVLASLCGPHEEVGAQGRPGRLASDIRGEPVGSGVEHLNGLGWHEPLKCSESAHSWRSEAENWPPTRPDREPPWGIEPQTYALRWPWSVNASDTNAVLTRRNALNGARRLWHVNNILRTPCGPPDQGPDWLKINSHGRVAAPTPQSSSGTMR